MAVPVFFRQQHGNPQSPTTWNYTHLVNGVNFLDAGCHKSMSNFMIGSGFLFFIAYKQTPAFSAHHYFIPGVFKILVANCFLILPCCPKCGFVDKICQVCPCKTGSPTSNCVKTYFLIQLNILAVSFKNVFPPLDIRRRNDHMPVKTSRTQQGRVKHIRTVCRRNHNNTFIDLKSVHFHKQLVKRLLPFIVTPSKSCAAAASHRINFVNEDDARGVFFPLHEHIPNSAGTNTYKHFYKIRPADTEKRYRRFPGNCLGKQSFSCTRLSHQQNTPWNFTAETLKFSGILEKIHNFLKFFSRFINPLYVSKFYRIVFSVGYP